MCGIAGIYGAIAPGRKSNILDALSGSLAHRGPDGCGRFQDDHVGLTHTRLSIIDLSANGNQPLYNEDKSLVLICNGEIYNYKEIRAELLAKGHQFRSNSDCEVILHLYEENKDSLEKVVARLTGMFAFALWDTVRKRLFIARDRVGIKPLYYSYEGGQLVFASEVKPVAASGLSDYHIDTTSLYEYFLTGSIPAPNTLYKEVRCFPPGHLATIDDSRLAMKEYWDIPKGLRKWRNEDELLEETDAHLSAIVKDHLVADVPVGTFLSAGVDSSLITAYAVGHHPGIHSFTAAFPGEPEDEGMIAAATAAKLHTTHHSYELKSDFFNDFGAQFHDIDQPFAISSALSLGRISKMARADVKVVLSGDGADELFGGYGRYENPQFPDFLKYIPQPLQNNLLKMGAKVTGKKSLEQLRQNLQVTDARRFFDRILITKAEMALSFFDAKALKDIDTERYLHRIERLYEKRKGEDDLNRTLYVDMKTALVDEMLTKCDRMTMINGIEGRVPFLDHRLVELAVSIPGSFKRHNGTGKVVLRKLLAKKLGNELAFRVKTGFNSPLKQWLTSDKKTIDFVKREIGQARKLPFLASGNLEQYEREPHTLAPGLVYSLVCLSSYMEQREPVIN